jgi:hypothetical protein
MRVFIAFSGTRSRLVGEALKDFIRDVLQAVKPFMSSDIPKGTSWPKELAVALEQCEFGIPLGPLRTSCAPALMY